MLGCQGAQHLCVSLKELALGQVARLCFLLLGQVLQWLQPASAIGGRRGSAVQVQAHGDEGVGIVG
jgi:hypothetical protein